MKKINKIAISIMVVFIVLLLGIATIGLNFIYSDQEYYMSEKEIQIPIFVYHDIVEKKTEEEFMQTTKENFEKQITGFQELGYEFIRYDDLIAYKKGEKKLKEKSILLSFDDGIEGNYIVLFPIVKQHRIPIAINIVIDNIGKPGALNWDQIKEMSDSRIS